MERSPLLDIVARVREPVFPSVVVAHRGDSQNRPENTLAAFELAVAGGAEMVEFDVHLTADGDVVVIHDDKVDRTTDGHGDVLRLPTEAVRELSAGAWFAARYADERVPILDEVLDLCRGRAVPMIEVKARRRRSPELGERVAEALERHAVTESTVVICREMSRVEEVLRTAPAARICYITFTKRQARAATRLPGVTGVDPYWKSLSLSLIDELRAARFFLTPWTVNRPRDMERLLLLGCEAIITDCPVTLRDRIEGFEFARAQDLQERFRSGNADLDLELEESEDAASPEEVSRAFASASDADLPGIDPEG